MGKSRSKSWAEAQHGHEINVIRGRFGGDETAVEEERMKQAAALRRHHHFRQFGEEPFAYLRALK
jgi:hypothetical protein